MKALVLTILTLAVLLPLSNAQIINMESRRITTDTTGFSGRMGISLAASRFTQSYLAVDISGQVQYKTEKNLFLFVSDFQNISAGGVNFNNSGFGHLRYNRKFSDVIRGELFSQIQYNSVTKISRRVLNGIGIRFKLSTHESAKIYWGIAYMNEYEELSDPSIINKDNRLSSYFTFTLLPVDKISFRNTTYIQPKLDDFNDYRLANNTLLNFGITDNLKFTTVFSFLYDSRPPIDIPTITYQVRNGLNYTFQ